MHLIASSTLMLEMQTNDKQLFKVMSYLVRDHWIYSSIWNQRQSFLLLSLSNIY